VISHAGAGTTLEVLEKDKTLITVVNETLMNNHQLELASKLQSAGYCLSCTPCTLEQTIEKLALFEKQKYTSGEGLNNFKEQVSSFLFGN